MRPPVRPRRTAALRGDQVARPTAPPVVAPRVVRPVPVPPDAPAPDGPDDLDAVAEHDGTGGAGPAAPGRVLQPVDGDGPRGTGTLLPTRPPSFPARPPVVSTGSAARFAERAARNRRLTRRRVTGAATTAGVVLALAWLLLLSPVLALDLDEVLVRGEGTVVDVVEVTDVVERHDGTPLPRLDTVTLRREILDVPGVRAAEVARVWPHGLRITLVARQPVAAVPRDGGFALLDVEGVQVGRADARPPHLPVIEVPREDPGARAMTAVLTVLEQLPPEIADTVTRASARTQDTVTFTLTGGARVEWGSADDTALKVRVLQTLREAEPSRRAKVFDVSAPTMPITTS